MEILGLIAKVLFIVLWPVLLMFIYYLIDREGFKRYWQKFKNDILKK
jgi:hypothetical protein